MQRIVDEIVEIPLSVCEILIENFELDLYELSFISPADLAQEIANDKEEIRKFLFKDIRDRMTNDDFDNPDHTTEKFIKSSELIRAKIKDKEKLLTVDLEYFLNHMVITLSKRERLTYLNYTPFTRIFTHGVCEELKLRKFSNEIWEKITKLFTYSFGLWGRMICLTYWADDDVADKTAYYVLEPDEEIEKEKELPLDNRLWFSLDNVVQRLQKLGVSKDDVYYLCSNGEIECCVDIASLDRPLRRFEPNTSYQNKVSRLVKFERSFPPEVEYRRVITSLGLRYIMPDNTSPLSRLLAIDAIYISKILYQGFCDYWEAGVNGFEAVFGDTHPDYNHEGIQHFETIKLSKEHLIVTSREMRRLETEFSDNTSVTDFDGLSKGAWKMTGVLIDLLKETDIYTSDNDIKTAILAQATEHNMKGLSLRNLDTFFRKAKDSKCER